MHIQSLILTLACVVVTTLSQGTNVCICKNNFKRTSLFKECYDFEGFSYSHGNYWKVIGPTAKIIMVPITQSHLQYGPECLIHIAVTNAGATQDKRFLGFSGSVDSSTDSSGGHSYGGTVDSPFGGLSGHVHTSHGHVSGGDLGVSTHVDGIDAGVHGGYDHGKGVSGGLDLGASVPGVAGFGTHVDYDHSGIHTSVDASLGGSKVTVDEHGHATYSGSVPVGK